MAIAVLVMAYGTPDRLEDVEAYYTHICGGRRPRPELLAELIGRYRAIGGRSPLTEITARQALALEAKLKERGEWRVYMAMKHWHPFIADTVERMVADGVRAAVGLPLSPLISPAATGGYETAALAAADGRIRWRFPPSWHTHPLFVEAVAQRVRRALRLLPAADQPTPVVFTAHSLPVSAVLAGDPYPHLLAEAARAVAGAIGLDHWHIAYQSAGRTEEDWLGPDVSELLVELRQRGHRTAVVCPVGFVSDHLEVLYDIDVDCSRLAKALGLQLVRTASLNDDPVFVEALADVIEANRP